MEIKGMERIYYFTDFILRMVYLNILAIIFTIAGGVVFGFFPAIVATFSISRKWLMGYSDIKITKNFWLFYKKEFVRSNVVGWILIVLGSLLFVNLSIAEIVNQAIIQASYYLILTVFLLFSSACLFIFPIYLHYKTSIPAIFKHACLLLFVHPINTLMLIGAVILYHYVMTILPGLIPFFSISLFSILVMFFSLRTFHRLGDSPSLD
ncbi:YesL family protein [Lederbergia galactosidilytica]|nr:DUF624 domain-containing protein [Lederbergia galactosidilytica]OAK71238.1 hypothetical protein ABB05_10855 [Lederbergia galactosidilytica]